jgi:hypothetical protein
MFSLPLSRRFTAVASITAVVALGIGSPALPAAAVTPAIVQLTTNCDAPLELRANVGDVIEITMTHPGCSGSEPSIENSYGYASLNNLNGTYSDGTANYPGTSTGAGFLDYVSHSAGLYFADYYWSTPTSTVHDWSVIQTLDGGEDVVVMATLRATDGAGNPLTIGSTVADIFQDVPPFFGSPGHAYGVREFAVTYAGLPSGSAGSSDAELAKTGLAQIPLIPSVLLAVTLGLALILRSRMGRKL